MLQKKKPHATSTLLHTEGQMYDPIRCENSDIMQEANLV